MTPEQQAEFGNRVHYGTQHTETTQHQAESHTDNNVVQAEVVTTDEQAIHAQETDIAQTDTPSSSGGEVHILGVEHVAMEDGSMMGVAMAEVDGMNAAFIDIDNDGVVDGVALDVNNDGQFTANEMADVQDQNIHMDQLQQQMDAQNYMASAENSGPDYINDANVGGYA